MKNWLLSLIMLGATIIPAQAALTLNFSNVTNANITFSGGSFSFVDGDGGYDFSITGSAGGTGDAVGLLGNLGGSFAIGTISDLGGGLLQAPVTGAGSLSINDGSNLFTADVDWKNIRTLDTAGGLNATGSINLTNLAYSGSFQDLLQLKNALTGIGVITFQFIPAVSLTDLKTGQYNNSYSGTFAAAPVPEPTSIFLFGSMLLGCGIWLRRRGIKIG